MKQPLVAKLAAEALGTFFVTATAISVDVSFFTGTGVDFVSRWLARGFMTAVVIYAFAETSGAHADPVVSIAFALRRVFPVGLTIAYIVAQFAGSFLAAALLFLAYGPHLFLGASHPGPGIAPLEATICEIVATFALVLTILMTAQEQAVVGKQASLAVGFVVAACGFAAGPISGASMNPARTIAPQILSGRYSQIWPYAVGPLVGAAIAVAVHALVSGRPSRGERRAAKGK